jgi:two-component system sensor histidine kinase SenX3
VRRSELRDRLDALSARFAVDPTRPSASIEEAAERLSVAMGTFFVEDAAARATTDQLVRAIDVIPQGIVLADVDGNVVFRNRAASGFFAARHSAALVESAIAELIATAVGGEAVDRTLDLFGPPRMALQLRAVPLSQPDDAGAFGAAAGAFVVVEDVSERQRLDAVRRDFVANISHELKTPVGALGLLAETLVGETDPQVAQRLAERMQREAFRVATTIDDLLQLSQIEAGEAPTREPVPVHLVLAEAVDRTRPAADLGRVRLVTHEPNRRLSVVGDRRQLVSAVANLCDNAVKYSDPDGTITLSVRTDGRWVSIDVADTGIGIPDRDLERVFERFYRVDRARSRDTGGTGLGLAIVRHVVQNHEGEVTVASREGEGSTFTLRLPPGPGPVAVHPDQEAVS